MTYKADNKNQGGSQKNQGGQGGQGGQNPNKPQNPNQGQRGTYDKHNDDKGGRS